MNVLRGAVHPERSPQTRYPDGRVGIPLGGHCRLPPDLSRQRRRCCNTCFADRKSLTEYARTSSGSFAALGSAQLSRDPSTARRPRDLRCRTRRSPLRSRRGSSVLEAVPIRSIRADGPTSQNLLLAKRLVGVARGTHGDTGDTVPPVGGRSPGSRSNRPRGNGPMGAREAWKQRLSLRCGTIFRDGSSGTRRRPGAATFSSGTPGTTRPGSNVDVRSVRQIGRETRSEYEVKLSGGSPRPAMRGTADPDRCLSGIWAVRSTRSRRGCSCWKPPTGGSWLLPYFANVG